MIDWSGIFHIMATPFTESGELDEPGIALLVDKALATGIRGFTVLGIAGEAHRLTDDERRRVVGATVRTVAGRVPVVAGVSAGGLHLASAFSRMARDEGAEAVMVAPPNGVKNLDAVAEYYHAVAKAAAVPLVIQDEPVTTQVTMPAPFIARLFAELPAAEAVKLEEAPTLPKITRLRALFERRIAIFGGLGGVYFFEELSRGADGATTRARSSIAGYPSSATRRSPARFPGRRWRSGRRSCAGAGGWRRPTCARRRPPSTRPPWRS